MQSPQKGAVIDEITPISPLPSRYVSRRGRLDRLERKRFLDALDDLRCGIDLIRCPFVARADIHVFDEAHDVSAALETARQLDDAAIVDSSDNDAVDLYGAEADAVGCFDAFEDRGDREVPAVETTEHLVVDAVEADRHAMEARRRQISGLFGEHHAVGGQSDVFDAVNGGQLLDQARQVASQQRFPAGDAQLLRAEGRCDPGDTRDLLEREELGPRQERIALPENLRRHAVGAAEVASIGYRDAKVAQRSAAAVRRLCAAAWGNGHGTVRGHCLWSRGASLRIVLSRLVSGPLLSGLARRPAGPVKLRLEPVAASAIPAGATLRTRSGHGKPAFS